jgi:hypothetical protein
MRLVAACLGIAFGAAVAAADVVVLVNGDRITGRVVGSVSKRVRLQTPYGVLVIPVESVDRIKRDDGSEEVLRAAPAPAPTPTPIPAPSSATLLLVVTGASFWHAWDPKSAPLDPSLRLELRLDEHGLASYTDVNLDPEDLPKAIVNSFVFSPERLFVSGGVGITVAPPSLGSGEIRLEIRVPAVLAGEGQLRLAYQLNDAESAAPQWRDVVVASAPVTLVAGRSVRVRVQQDRGTMEYERKQLRGVGQMRGVETFRTTLEVEPADVAP